MTAKSAVCRRAAIVRFPQTEHIGPREAESFASRPAGPTLSLWPQSFGPESFGSGPAGPTLTGGLGIYA